jgi:hypothetical protein
MQDSDGEPTLCAVSFVPAGTSSSSARMCMCLEIGRGLIGIAVYTISFTCWQLDSLLLRDMLDVFLWFARPDA